MISSFIWPAFLWGLLILPLLALLYVRFISRPAPFPVSFSTTPTLRQAAWTDHPLRRHVSAALLLVAMAAVIVALARPVAPLPVPADRSAIMLAIDVSGSMRSMDVAPNRFEAARTAAKMFVRALPERIRVGLVAFAGFAALIVPPVTDHQRVLDGIDGLGLARRTAIGEGLLEAVAALPGRSRPDRSGALPPLPAHLPPGIVVLLSDGRSNTGLDPLDAAAIARQQQVTVYTIGLGQPESSGAWTIGGSLDEETLQAMATITGGSYQRAASAYRLHDIYRRLARSVGWEQKPAEVTAVAAGLAAALLVAALVVSRIIVAPLAV